jgi:DNA-binding winged helix-turn-helix (wHTH) protein
MIPKSGYRFSEKIMRQQLEHDPEKACPGLDPGGYRFSEKIML